MNDPTGANQLADHPPFRELDPEALNALVAAGTLEQLSTGSFIEHDQLQDYLHILWSGAMELHLEDGERRRLGPGLILGLDAYLEEDQTHYNRAVTLRPSQVLKVPFNQLQKLEQAHPELSNVFNHIIADRIRSREIMADNDPQGALAQPVSRVMNAPLVTCPHGWPLRLAVETMRTRKIGSMGVIGDDGKLTGLVTLTSLAEATLLHGRKPDDPVSVACERVQTASHETPLWQAEALQKRKGIKYLVITEQGQPTGMISQTNILHALLAQQDVLLEWIGRADTPEQLRDINSEVLTVARNAWERNRNADRAVRLISDFHLAIQRRCVELTLEQLREQGRGEAPRRYVLIIMGSGGRREMLINPDQDNGIIISDDGGRPLDQDEEHWFLAFTDALNRNLDTAGYILCPGDIMARSPAYRKTLDGWCRIVTQHTRYPGRSGARWANIVLDFALLYGDPQLYTSLWTHTLESFSRRPRLLRFMADDDAQGRPALGLFNRLVTAAHADSRGKVDIKRQGLRLICDAARIFALHAGISESNTVDRLRGLVRQGELSADLADSVIAAHEEFMDLLLTHQVRQMQQGQAPDKLINPDQLVPMRRESLRMAMHAVKRFQDQLQGRFGL